MKPSGRFPLALVTGTLLILSLSASAFAETETETWTQTGTFSTATLPTFHFSMAPQAVPGQPTYKEGSGQASIAVQGTELRIHFDADGMMGGAHFTLVLLVGTTSQSVANMATDNEGEIEAGSYLSLAPGTYDIGLKVLDTSSFGSPTTVLVSSPLTQSISLSSSSATTSTMTTVEETQAVSTVQGGKTEDDGIRSAIQTSFIPAVVDVGNSGSSVQLKSGSFSVSVGTYQQRGFLVSITGSNVTGPRALLLNVTSAQTRGIFSAPFQVALDGANVQEASSLTQVLSPKAGDPSRFIIILTSSALELLVTIPHFSSHVITVAPVVMSLADTLIVNLPALVLSFIALTGVIATIYIRRNRVVV